MTRDGASFVARQHIPLFVSVMTIKVEEDSSESLVGSEECLSGADDDASLAASNSFEVGEVRSVRKAAREECEGFSFEVARKLFEEFLGEEHIRYEEEYLGIVFSDGFRGERNKYFFLLSERMREIVGSFLSGERNEKFLFCRGQRHRGERNFRSEIFCCALGDRFRDEVLEHDADGGEVFAADVLREIELLLREHSLHEDASYGACLERERFGQGF